MAGNIVKWWKHKILGGYKQFSVLQECATDSEELMYPIRAPSSCSAPPDLLLTGDRNKDTKVKSTSPRVDAISPDRMLLEEFTCDVSVEGGGKSTQPLQFSFTFYDLDGHHGKITKDDIAGIVYTIYESIGKSVVVPHCGSKTINVRLTVSPDSKPKSEDSSNSAKKPLKKQRLKSRKLFKADDDEEGSGSGCVEVNQNQKQSIVAKSTTNQCTEQTTCKSNIYSNEPMKSDAGKDVVDGLRASCYTPEMPKSQNHHRESRHRQSKLHQDYTENIYEIPPIITMENSTNTPTVPIGLKPKIDKLDVTLNNNNSCCRDCPPTNLYQIDASMPISKPCVRRLMRKSRSRKPKNVHDNCPQTRLRSLSVGNENSYRNGIRRPVHLNTEIENGDASSGASGKDRNDECLNNLKRNDLIDIIRESMEKSRLCFQSNGKTNVSPTKHHRHRSYTITSKMTPIDTHTPEPPTNGLHGHHNSKINWCGYDSMLHAKICSTNNIISNPVLAAHTSKLLHNLNNTTTPNNNNLANNNNNNQLQQQHPQQPQQQQQQQQQQRSSRSRQRHHNNEFSINASPQIQGYSKLMSTQQQNSKLNTALLSQLNPALSHQEKLNRTLHHVEDWLCSSATSAAANILDVKNINCKETNLCKDDECLNNTTFVDKFNEANKLTKKINEIGPSPSRKTFNKENLLTRKSPKTLLSSSQRNSSNSDSQMKIGNNVTPSPAPTVVEPKENIMEYASIPIVVDPSQSECENLLRASSDESSSQVGMTDNASMTTIHRYVHIHHHYYHH